MILDGHLPGTRFFLFMCPRTGGRPVSLQLASRMRSLGMPQVAVSVKLTAYA
jgi:hypothetical protein